MCGAEEKLYNKILNNSSTRDFSRLQSRPVSLIFAPAMTQEQLKDMRDRLLVLRRFL